MRHPFSLVLTGLVCCSAAFLLLHRTAAAEKELPEALRPGQLEYPDAPTTRCTAKTDTHFNSLMITEDSFEKVVSHYQRLTGVDLSADQPGRVRIHYRSQAGGQWSMFVDDSADNELKSRPIQMRMLSQDNDDHHLTIVISRVSAESTTHIWIVYHKKPQ